MVYLDHFLFVLPGGVAQQSAPLCRSLVTKSKPRDGARFLCVCFYTLACLCVFSSYLTGNLCSCLICHHETKARLLSHARRPKIMQDLEIQGLWNVLVVVWNTAVKHDFTVLITDNSIIIVLIIETVLRGINCLFGFLYPSPKIILPTTFSSSSLPFFSLHIVASPLPSSSLAQLRFFFFYIPVFLVSDFCNLFFITHHPNPNTYPTNNS